MKVGVEDVLTVVSGVFESNEALEAIFKNGSNASIRVNELPPLFSVN